MPQPVPAPTVAELVIVSEITLLPYETVETMVAADSSQAVSDAKWARTLADIAAWPEMQGESGDLKRVGSIEFFEDAAGANRLDFRNRVRARYGQVLLTSEIPADANFSKFGVSSQQWF
jgi:hypothetical protein